MSYWIKAPEWANAVITSKDGQRFYVSQWGGISARQRVGYSEVDTDASADMIAPHDWTLVATRKAPWTGSGLPPVGTVCEHEGRQDDREWLQVTVIAHTQKRGRDVAVFEYEDEVSYSSDGFFRPIRTPEQIAAEEREKAIQEMAEHMAGYKDVEEANTKMVSLSTYLHDHGYRKQSTDQ